MKMMLLFFTILISVCVHAQINPEIVSPKQQYLYVVKIGELSSSQEQELSNSFIIGKDWKNRTYEISEEQKSLLDLKNIRYNIIERGIRISSNKIESTSEIIEKPVINGEASRSGSNGNDISIPDNGSATSIINISGAPTGAKATRIVYDWDIDHNYVADCYIKCGTDTYNDGEQRLSKTGDDWADGYNETSKGSRTSYPTGQNVNQNWVIIVSDKTTNDVGIIDSWSITVYYTTKQLISVDWVNGNNSSTTISQANYEQQVWVKLNADGYQGQTITGTIYENDFGTNNRSVRTITWTMPSSGNTAWSSWTINDFEWETGLTEDHNPEYFVRVAADGMQKDSPDLDVSDRTNPSQVTLNSPSDGYSTTSRRPTFTWNTASDGQSGIESYEIQFNSEPSKDVGNTTSYTPTSDMAGGLNTWKVRSKDKAGNYGSWSNSRNITIVIYPDLKISSISLDKSSVQTGQTVTVSYTLTNQGATTAGTSKTGIYLSSSQYGMDRIIDEVTENLLTVGQSVNRSKSVTIPSDVTTGTHYIVAAADYNNQVNEGTTGGEDNNNNGKSLSITRFWVNTVSISVTPLSLNVGQSITTSGIISGTGNGSVILQWEWKKPGSSIWESMSGLDESYTMTNGSATITSATKYPFIAAGSYYIRVKISSPNGVTSNEVPVTVIDVIPDLTISSISLDKNTVQPGQTVTVSYTFKNQGSGGANSTLTGFYLSSTQYGRDRIIDEVQESSISSGQSVDRSKVITIPADATPGDYFIVASADQSQLANEGSSGGENNNNNGKAITVAYPLLAVDAELTPTGQPTDTWTLYVDNQVAKSGTGTLSVASTKGTHQYFGEIKLGNYIARTKTYTANVGDPGTTTNGNVYWNKVNVEVYKSGVIMSSGYTLLINGQSQSSSIAYTYIADDAVNIPISVTYNEITQTKMVSYNGILGIENQRFDFQSLLMVPYYYQGGSPYCAYASIAMLLRYNNLKITPKDVAGYFKADARTGSSLGEVYSEQWYDYIVSLGLNPEITKWDRSFVFGNPRLLDEYIIKSINEQKPLFLGVKDQTHAIVITGTSQDGIFVHDPSGVILEKLLIANNINAFLSWSQFHDLFSLTWSDYYINTEFVTVRINNLPSVQASPITMEISPAFYNDSVPLTDPIDWTTTSSFYFYDKNNFPFSVTWNGVKKYRMYTVPTVSERQHTSVDPDLGIILLPDDKFKNIVLQIPNVSASAKNCSINLKIYEINTDGSEIKELKSFNKSAVTLEKNKLTAVTIFGDVPIYSDKLTFKDLNFLDTDIQTIQYVEFKFSIENNNNILDELSVYVAVNNYSMQDIEQPKVTFNYNVVWRNSNLFYDIDFSDNTNLNNIFYQINSNDDSNPSNWHSLTGDGINVLAGSQNNQSSSLTTDWKISNTDWNSLSVNAQNGGRHYIYFKVTDDAGNVYITPSQAEAFAFGKDTNPPNISFTSPEENQTISTNTTEVKWAADDLMDGLSLSGLDSIYYKLDQEVNFTKVTGDIRSVILNNLANGPHTVYLKAKDKAGNYSSVRELHFTVNTQINPPLAFSLLSPANNSTISNLRPTLKWNPTTDPDGTSIKYELWYADNPSYTNKVQISDLITTQFQPVSNLTDKSTYYWKVKAIDASGQVKWANETDWKFFIDSHIYHFTKSWSGNPYLPMNIYIQSASLEGIGLAEGDEIAVFDGNVCVGVINLTGPIQQGQPLSLIASADDPGSSGIDGFATGHSMTFKYWKNDQSKEVGNISCELVQGTNSFQPLGTVIVTLKSISSFTHTLSLSQGWNIFSICVTPPDQNLKTIFQPLIDAGKLIKVQDEKGNAIENIPGINWINNIGNWGSTEGYYAKVNSASNISVTGTAVSLPLTVPLISGWNIVSYPLQTAQNALTIIQKLKNESSLVKVQDETGNAIVNIGGTTWINDIGNFNPGKGYYVRVNKNTDFTYQASNQLSANLVKPPVTTLKKTVDKHFSPCYIGNPYLPMNIYLLHDGNTLTKSGAEIGVFDGDKCVGAITLDNINSSDTLFSLIACMDDPQTQEVDGFISGNQINLRYWDGSSEKGMNIVSVNNDENTFRFAPQGTAVFRLVKLTRVDDQFPVTYSLLESYPNPFNPITTLRFGLVEESFTRLSIFDNLGKEIRTIVQEYLKPGVHYAVWDGKDNGGNIVPSGVYFCRLQNNKDIKTIKLLMLK